MSTPEASESSSEKATERDVEPARAIALMIAERAESEGLSFAHSFYVVTTKLEIVDAYLSILSKATDRLYLVAIDYDAQREQLVRLAAKVEEIHHQFVRAYSQSSAEWEFHKADVYARTVETNTIKAMIAITGATVMVDSGANSLERMSQLPLTVAAELSRITAVAKKADVEFWDSALVDIGNKVARDRKANRRANHSTPETSASHDAMTKPKDRGEWMMLARAIRLSGVTRSVGYSLWDKIPQESKRHEYGKDSGCKIVQWGPFLDAVARVKPRPRRS